MKSSSPTFLSIRQVLKYLVAPPDDELEKLLQLFKTRTLEAGEYFARSGDLSIDLGFVNSGLLRFFYQTGDGKEFNKSFITENQFAAAYSAFLTGLPARFSIQAIEKSHLLTCDLALVVNLFDQHRCWEKLGRLLAEQLYIKKETREAEFLLDDAETRYLNFQTNYPGLEDRLTQYHVASYLGITPVMLSRIRRR
ncbi:MAG: Crp/Fnr family transcriptional regulator [Gammaproteobacteria bacterium]|nr:Crp/Fnr family transcriptional regulator [Gammaproteobacteria bacterium]